jgi:hypothetical protein
MPVNFTRRAFLSNAAKAAVASKPDLAHSRAEKATDKARLDRRTSFDDGWRFSLGDVAGAQLPGFQDQAWSPTDLPHDTWLVTTEPVHIPPFGICGRTTVVSKESATVEITTRAKYEKAQASPCTLKADISDLMAASWGQTRCKERFRKAENTPLFSGSRSKIAFLDKGALVRPSLLVVTNTARHISFLYLVKRKSDRSREGRLELASYMVRGFGESNEPRFGAGLTSGFNRLTEVY